MFALPAAIPLTIPELFMLAIVGAPLLQVPPPAPSVNVVVDATHTDAAPLMVPADGTPMTVTTE